MINRVDAYGILADELRARQAMPYSDVVALVGTPVQRRVVERHGVEYTVETQVQWKDFAAGVAKVAVTVLTPSTWRLEKMQKTILVDRPNSREGAGRTRRSRRRPKAGRA